MNDPAEAGWIVVVPDDDEGRDIAEALEPLINHRLRVRSPESGSKKLSPADVIRYFPAGASNRPDLLGEWFEKSIAFPVSGDISDDQPFYVLIAGSPAKIPFDLDHLIFIGEQTVGRLAFPDIAAYRRYADKVVAWEPDDDAPRTTRRGLPVGVFAPDHGVHDPTHLSRVFLADALLDYFREKDAARPCVARIGDDASRDALLGLLRGAEAAFTGPRLLFSASHGLAVRRGAAARDKRLLRQGAICCQDARYLPDEILTADALGDGALLQGGIWLLFACFGGGTPAESDFFKALGETSLLGFHDGGPFLAALPTKLLANPDGPLAVIGHLDPGFIHSFSRPGSNGGERRAKILKAVNLLLEGCRAGVSTGPISGVVAPTSERLRALNHRLETALKAPPGTPDQKLAQELEEKSADPVIRKLRDELVDLSVTLNDFRNFIILGDPAVKLPRAGAKPGRADAISGAAAGALALSTAAFAAAPAAASATGPAPQSATAPDAAHTPPGLHPLLLDAQREGRLVLTTMEALFSAEGVPIAAAGETVIALVGAACAHVSDVREQPPEEDPDHRRSGRYYEAVEHQDCDALVEVRFSASEAWLAQQIRLPLANGVELRYGEAISLFGDFYGAPGAPIGAGPEAFLSVFEQTFESGDRTEMCRILRAMGKERAAVEAGKGQEGGAASAYERAVADLNGEYNRATGGGSFVTPLLPQGRFLRLAAVNYDHFGWDAVAAYRAAHTAACREALAARDAPSPEERQRRLTRAYLMNACGDHFLTDLFASGHLRVPRRALSQQVELKLLGDLLAKRMHDEDNARGLLVTNVRKDEWRAYGDQRFLSDENETGRRLTREAVRASAGELWAAFEHGAEPAFAALDIAPDIGDALTSPKNHAPLFLVDGGTLKARSRPFDLECREWTSDFSSVALLLQRRHGEG